MIVEYRVHLNTRQESYCFMARLKGEKGEPHLMEDEVEDGFQTLWVSIDEAIRLIRGPESSDHTGRFMQKRDTVFLEEAKKRKKKMILTK